jgi:hypothetical protein
LVRRLSGDRPRTRCLDHKCSEQLRGPRIPIRNDPTVRSWPFRLSARQTAVPASPRAILLPGARSRGGDRPPEIFLRLPDRMKARLLQVAAASSDLLCAEMAPTVRLIWTCAGPSCLKLRASICHRDCHRTGEDTFVQDRKGHEARPAKTQHNQAKRYRSGLRHTGEWGFQDRCL